ncbi:MAG: AraC family transcriptional regulator [Cyclobacteriaceae bacterium]
MISHYIRRNNSIHTQSFSVAHNKAPNFFKLWQHHQELELVFILKGKGIRFIGDSIEPFVPGDFILLGEDLPHKWQNNPEYFQNKGLIAEAIIIHFERAFLHNALDNAIELTAIKELIESAQRGIIFKGYSKVLAAGLLQKIVNTPPGLHRFVQLLDLLRILAEEKDFEFITKPGYRNSHRSKDAKLLQVDSFIMNHFQSSISLEDVAREVEMNKSSFCRYFRKTTQKHFSNYLNEIRIGYACKLLQVSKQRKIAEVCFESGFNNLSNFNDKFKQHTGHTPSDYAKLFA